MTYRRLVAFGFAAALGALSAQAQESLSRPTCAAIDDSKIPAALSGWLGRTPLPAAGAAADTGASILILGKGVDAGLKRTGDVAFPVLPGKPGGSASYGGLYELRIVEAGDYQVSLGAGAWIEVVDGEGPVVATAHAHGSPCASLRKSVVFPLKPGRHLLEISGNGEPTLPLMLSRVLK